MDPKTTDPLPERGITDESLRSEREAADDTVVTGSDVNATADKVLALARERADAVLAEAQRRADENSEAVDPLAEAPVAVALLRAVAASRLRRERATADRLVRGERAEEAEEAEEQEEARLALERAQTDRDLEAEREASDVKLDYRNDFLGMACHDLRNYLCGLVLEASDLTSAASDSDEGRRVVAGMQRVQRYVARMNALVGDLVDIESIDAGKLFVRPVESDATAILLETIDTFTPSATAKGISLAYETSAPVLTAVLDTERIHQLLSNLVSNALKFTSPGGEIVLRGERRADEFLLSVRDTGEGIPSEQLVTIFDRFFQVKKDDRRGLGLGLHISKCIVEAHGGKIWAESILGKGSCFFSTFPGKTVTGDRFGDDETAESGPLPAPTRFASQPLRQGSPGTSAPPL